MLKIFIAIILIASLSGCAFFGKNYVIGSGSYEKEYYEDGTLKSEKRECRSPISDVVNIQGIKTD